MRLSSDGMNCEKIEEILLFISGTGEIRGVDLKQPYSNAISTISHATEIISPMHLDFDPTANRLYWTDFQLNEMKTVELSTNFPSTTSSQKIEIILDTMFENVNGFAIDWISGLAFFSQRMPEDEISSDNPLKTHRLMVSNLNGEFVSKILDDLNEVYSLIVSPKQ